MSVYFWQQHEWQALAQAYRQQRLAHALLLSGALGLGKYEFAMRLANGLLCTDGSDLEACGQCKSCNLFAAGTHPDLHLLQAEQNARDIKIEQVRALLNKLQLHAQQGGYKVVIINPVERMSIGAANSLLKTLEEPSATSIIILINHGAQILATLRSRCQQINFTAPAYQDAKHWLEQQDGVQNSAAQLAISDNAPLAALKHGAQLLSLRTQLIDILQQLGVGQDALSLAAQLDKQINDADELLQIYRWQQSFVGDLIKLKLCQEHVPLHNQDSLQILRQLAPAAKLERLFAFYAQLQTATALYQHPLNRQQQLEALFLEFANCCNN